jgi:hypothetical protein
MYFFIMAQFDSLIIFPLIWSLLFTLVFHYTIIIKLVIPNFLEVKKFREKKLYSPKFFEFFNLDFDIKLNKSYLRAL